MDRIMVAATIGMVIVFGGFMVGVIAMICSWKEDKRRSRTQQAPDDAARDVWVLNGVVVPAFSSQDTEDTRV
jgi:hypothetical protein